VQPSVATLVAAALALGGWTAAAAQEATGAEGGTVTARLTMADGTDVGRVTLLPMRAGVLVEAELTDLPPGPHGFHIHQTGACTPDFAAAGGHLAPEGHEHGFAQTETPHAGDLPNVFAAADGTAHVQFINWRLKMEDVLDEDGSAIVVHAAEDTYMDPTSAGDRFACGVVEQQS
jgi:superoxide dismutase, Cu-Zn family